VLRRITLVKGLVLYAKHKMLESDEKLSLICLRETKIETKLNVKIDKVL
jgi:hypothetical protein